MHRIIHYSLLIAKFPGGGVQSSNYLPLIGYLLHPLIVSEEEEGLELEGLWPKTKA
jgi:hypothetical protein